MVEKRAIELIPKELEEEKKQSQMVRSARLVGFAILGLTLIATVIIFVIVGGQKAISKNIQSQITEKETRIGELSAIEEKLILFAHKNSALTEIFKNRSYFSLLLDALKKSTPDGVTVTGLTATGITASTTDGGTTDGSTTDVSATLTGEVINYAELATLLRNLIDPDKGGTLFTEASLTSVNFNPAEGLAQFIAEVKITPDGLKKGWEVLLSETAEE